MLSGTVQYSTRELAPGKPRFLFDSSTCPNPTPSPVMERLAKIRFRNNRELDLITG